MPQTQPLTQPFIVPGTGQPTFQSGQFLQPNLPQQPTFADLDVFIPQNPSGRTSIGGTYSTDNEFLGQLIIEEHDFDWRNPPGSIREAFTSPFAWRGGGQRFRLEAVPGTDLQRYLISWSNPYFRNRTSLSLSAFLFNRQYLDWDEQRLGGKINFGRRFTEYLSINGGLRLEQVEIDNPRVLTSPQLNAALGDNNLFLANIELAYDTRLVPYLSGVGTYLGLKFSQAFGDFSFSRGEIDFRHHRTTFQRRADGSGRRTIGFRSKLGFTGSDTPVFENFFAGGISSLRGFDFRGVSPIEGDVRVGGEFQWLNSVEYNFPISADDLIGGAFFADFGTVEEDIELNSDNFRAALGLGLRVHLPYAGLGAPISIDFAFPIETAAGDEEQTFSLFIGALR